MWFRAVGVVVGVGLCWGGSPVHAAETPVTPLTAAEYQHQVARTDYAAHTVDMSRFSVLLHEPKAVIFDLRDAAAYAQGHITNAHHLGMDIAADKIAKFAPDKNAPILLYCANSLQLTRMISQTNVALPQFLALGYRQVYLLKDAASDHGSFIEPHDRLARLPMVTEPPPPTKNATGTTSK
jgi:hypothetical protein